MSLINLINLLCNITIFNEKTIITNLEDFLTSKHKVELLYILISILTLYQIIKFRVQKRKIYSFPHQVRLTPNDFLMDAAPTNLDGCVAVTKMLDPLEIPL